MKAWGIAPVCAVVLLSGCAGQSYSIESAPEFVAARNDAPFYETGPGQFAPPEARLGAGERVKMIQKEFGYSRVILSNGLSGYMANEDLLPAPPLPKPRIIERPDRDDDDAADVPVVDDVALPEPDLSEAPEDAPPAN